MELSKMESELNTVWADLSEEYKMIRLNEIMKVNPPGTMKIHLIELSDAPLIKMCIGYVAMKYMFERLAKRELEEHNI